MSNSQSLTVQDRMEAIRAMALRSDEVAAQYENIYPGCAYLSVFHPMNQSGDPAGNLRIRFSRDEGLSVPVAAVFPVAMIGTQGGRDSNNPTPRNYQTPFNDKVAQEKYGSSLCHSSGNFEPDPMYHNRILTHPDANNREFVRAVTKFKGTELVNIPLTVNIGQVQDCRQCPLGTTYYGLYDEVTGKTPVVLRAVCKPVPSGVVYLLGVMGTGLLDKQHRILTQIPMQGQAARTAFSSKNDDPFIKSLGIPTALANVVLAKSVNSLPAYAVQAGQDIFFFPVLIGGVVATIEREGSAPGKVAVPFAFNTAAVIRKYMEANSESDIALRLAGAVRQAVSEFTAITKPQDIKSYSEQLYALLNATTPHWDQPESMIVHDEFMHVHEDFVKNGGMEKLTTPFRRVENAETIPSADNFPTNNEPTTATSSLTTADIEANAKLLQELSNASFGEVLDETVEEIPDDDRRPMDTFFGAAWG